MAEPLKVILLDGPLAGHVIPVPDGTFYWHVSVPKPISIIEMMREPGSVLGDTATYCIQPARMSLLDDEGADVHDFRVGTVESTQPSQAVLNEMAPTGLAEQGVLSWSEVPETPADRRAPVPIQAWGDPLVPCKVRVVDPRVIPVHEIDATCECGWWTERVPVARRSQLVRAAYKHQDGQWERRRRYALPIRIVDEGSGLTDTCLGGWQYDEDTRTIYGGCRVCGWRTEDVEPWCSKPLHDLWSRHAGPNGLTDVRNRLLTAYGLPVPTDEEDAERFERRRQRGGIADD